MQVTKLCKHYDQLQQIHGDSSLDAIYGAGQINKPKFCLVFMNPTARNISAHKEWKGLKAPWLGTKNVWRMFYQLGFINNSLYKEIQQKKPSEWDYEFSKKVYTNIKNNGIYITNLSKATQIDARPLKNEVFRDYLDLFKEEINIINPDIIITFGNQVSSILLNKPIKISEYRKKHESLTIKGKDFDVFPLFYPVGQGTRNMPKAKEDIDWIINQFKK